MKKISFNELQIKQLIYRCFIKKCTVSNKAENKSFLRSGEVNQNF